MSETEVSIAKVIDAYKAAVDARDIDAFMQLYDPAVRVFDAWGVWAYEGASVWRVAIKSWLASHQTDRLEVVFEEVASVSTAEFASVTAVVTYAVVSAQGERLNALQNRLTWILKPHEHALRIVHEHTSVPVGFEDQKAILQR